MVPESIFYSITDERLAVRGSAGRFGMSDRVAPLILWTAETGTDRLYEIGKLSNLPAEVRCFFEQWPGSLYCFFEEKGLLVFYEPDSATGTLETLKPCLEPYASGTLQVLTHQVILERIDPLTYYLHAIEDDLGLGRSESDFDRVLAFVVGIPQSLQEREIDRRRATDFIESMIGFKDRVVALTGAPPANEALVALHRFLWSWGCRAIVEEPAGQLFWPLPSYPIRPRCLAQISLYDHPLEESHLPRVAHISLEATD